MPYSVYCGLHGFMREDFETAAEALAQAEAWDEGGARFIQIIGPDDRDIALDDLRRRVRPETT